MTFVFMGIMAFILFLLYDINSIIMKNKLINYCFFLGVALLMTATMGIIISSRGQIAAGVLRIVLFGTVAAVFLILLVYTLFFALPFKDTYTDKDAARKVCKSGVYALCRHPGVLWFTGFYLFLGLSVNLPLLLIAAFLFSLLNLFYVIFQDKWTFIKTFQDYDQYKIETPFLIPNPNSLKHCIGTLTGKEVTHT